MGLDPTKSLNQKTSEALVLPLSGDLHYFGEEAIDGHIGRSTWEEKWGEQAGYLDEVGEQLGYSLWELHLLWLPWRAKFRPTGSTGPKLL